MDVPFNSCNEKGTDITIGSFCFLSALSPNAKRKIMQTYCVRKMGAVFFGGREILHMLNPQAALLKIMLHFSFNNAACFTSTYPLPPYFFTD